MTLPSLVALGGSPKPGHLSTQKPHTGWVRYLKSDLFVIMTKQIAFLSDFT